MIKAIKPKTCRVCRAEYTPNTSTQVVCRFECAVRLQGQKREALKREQTRQKREALKTRGDRLREAQIAFNRFIRARDAALPCISCGRDTGAKRNAGHYRSVGAAPELRFNELNVHGQCEHCNSYLSGNLIYYRKGLIRRVGVEVVEWLESNHPPLKLGIEELKQLKADYNRKARELEKQHVI